MSAKRGKPVDSDSQKRSNDGFLSPAPILRVPNRKNWPPSPGVSFPRPPEGGLPAKFSFSFRSRNIFFSHTGLSQKFVFISKRHKNRTLCGLRFYVDSLYFSLKWHVHEVFFWNGGQKLDQNRNRFLAQLVEEACIPLSSLVPRKFHKQQYSPVWPVRD